MASATQPLLSGMQTTDSLNNQYEIWFSRKKPGVDIKLYPHLISKLQPLTTRTSLQGEGVLCTTAGGRAI